MVKVSTRHDHGDEAPWDVTAVITSSGDDDDYDETSTEVLNPDSVRDAGRWELAVIPGAPPDSLYADGDWLYIWVPGP